MRRERIGEGELGCGGSESYIGREAVNDNNRCLQHAHRVFAHRLLGCAALSTIKGILRVDYVRKPTSSSRRSHRQLPDSRHAGNSASFLVVREAGAVVEKNTGSAAAGHLAPSSETEPS